MPRKSFANLENKVISRHFAAEEAAMTPPPAKPNDSATPADMAQREADQIAHALECYSNHTATPEQIAYLRALKRIL